ESVERRSVWLRTWECLQSSGTHNEFIRRFLFAPTVLRPALDSWPPPPGARARPSVEHFPPQGSRRPDRFQFSEDTEGEGEGRGGARERHRGWRGSFTAHPGGVDAGYG